MATDETDLPTRKKLPHDIPSWVPDDARHFITVNCRTRNIDQLCRDGIASDLIRTVEFYEGSNRWHLWLATIMPDHVHMIVSFNRQLGIKRVMAAWKGYNAKRFGIEWQEGFFEHRLRNIEEFEEKAFYVRQNPVRKGLVARAEDWPFTWTRT